METGGGIKRAGNGLRKGNVIYSLAIIIKHNTYKKKAGPDVVNKEQLKKEKSIQAKSNKTENKKSKKEKTQNISFHYSQIMIDIPVNCRKVSSLVKGLVLQKR